MDDAIDNIARDIRNRLYASEFRCLGSFLNAVMEASGAVGAGVVSMHEGRIISRRTVGVALSTFQDAIEAELLRPTSLSGASASVKATHTRSSTQTSLGEWTKDGHYLLLRRIWPASSWVYRSGEKAWLYVLGPRFVIPPKDCAGMQLTDQFGGLVSAFIRWKNEQFARHEELLNPPLADPGKVLRELKRLVVRPVLPVHFHALLSRLTPESKDAVEWARRISELLSICQRPVECSCKCNIPTGPSKTFTCPQTDSMDQVLSTLADLELWRTEFWKGSKHAEVSPDERAVLLEKAVRGLRSAAEFLQSDINWVDEAATKPIDFTCGAVGLNGERALLRNFCARGLKMALDRRAAEWQHSSTHSSELEFPSKFASLASTLLGDGRWTAEAIDNLLQVVALFGHHVLGIPERIDLVRHLRQTLRGETALHTLKARYRDHFFHTLEVCFIGFALLSSHPEEGGPRFSRVLVQRCHQASSSGGASLPPLTEAEADLRESDLLAQWWVAALIHDTAYGIDIFDGTLTLLDFFSNRKDIGEFLSGARGTVAKLAEPLQKFLEELNEDSTLRKGDHGVIAASSLAAMLNRIGPETAKRFLPAVRAIAFHNTRHPRVNAGRDPVAALLILCDTVQEWGRSSLGFSRSPAVLLSRLMEASLTPPEEQFGPVKRYGISLAPSGPSRPGDYHWTENGKLTIELDYGPESLKECRAKFTWADFTYNLQRVDFRPWGVELRVQVSVPFPCRPADQAGAKSQFEHFGDFIEEQEVRFIERWYRVARLQDPTKAVAYQLVGNAGDQREVILYNLCEMSREFIEETPLMGGRVGDFGASIMRWSVFAREQAEAPPAQLPPV